jgi:RNA polymerase sigma-70 factor (ECF subfamily)
MTAVQQAAAGAFTPTDADVVAASLADPPRFADIFERHYEVVHRYAQRRLGHTAADEVASETFLRAFDQRARFDRGQPDARPWLLGIATNILRRHWRTERRRLAAYARSVAVSNEAPPETQGLAEETLAALRRLRRAEREALLLHVWGELTYDEIAHALAIPIGTVRSRISRARARLRRALGSSASVPTVISEEVSHA